MTGKQIARESCAASWQPRLLHPSWPITLLLPGDTPVIEIKRRGAQFTFTLWDY